MNSMGDGWGQSDTRAQGISALRQKRERRSRESRRGGEAEVDVRGQGTLADHERRPWTAHDTLSTSCGVSLNELLL